MNTDVAIQIIDLALSLLKSLMGGTIQQDTDLAAILLQIIGKAVQAYQQHTGEPLDPAVIRAE